MFCLFYAMVILTLASLIYGLIRYEQSEYYHQVNLASRADRLKQKYTLDDDKQAAVNSFINYCKEEFIKRQDDN